MSTPRFLIGASGRLRAALLGGLALEVAPLEADPLTGGAYVLVGAPATGGTSQGGDFAITGYVAAAGATTSSGAEFALTCGLLGLYGTTGDGLPLKVELTPKGNVRLWWAADATGYQLEFTTALGPDAVWQVVDPIPTGNSFTTGPVPAARFFRLRQP